MRGVALAVPTSLSPSKVSSFRDCALAFRFSAIDRLPEPPSAPAVKGTLVHSALELLFCAGPEARTLVRDLHRLGVKRVLMLIRRHTWSANSNDVRSLARDYLSVCGFLRRVWQS